MAVQRALITGISGFVGGFLAEHLLELGDAVLGATADGDWLPTSPPGLAGRVELVAWDVGRDDGLPEASRRRIERFAPTHLYHLAAISVPAACGDQEPLPHAVAINVGGTHRAAQLAAALPTRPRVLLASSSHVYAPVDSDRPWVSESAPLDPRSAYGRTKLAAEEVLRRAIETLGIDALIVRSFSHAGPRQDGRLLLAQWARQVAEGREVVEVRSLDAWLDLSDVRDAVRAERALMEHGRCGCAYNLGSGVNRRSGEVMQLLREASGREFAVVETRPGRTQNPVADTSRLRAATAWRPEIPLQQTVADTLAWWRERLSEAAARAPSRQPFPAERNIRR